MLLSARAHSIWTHKSCCSASAALLCSASAALVQCLCLCGLSVVRLSVQPPLAAHTLEQAHPNLPPGAAQPGMALAGPPLCPAAALRRPLPWTVQTAAAQGCARQALLHLLLLLPLLLCGSCPHPPNYAWCCHHRRRRRYRRCRCAPSH